jgi:hypothetical protein
MLMKPTRKDDGMATEERAEALRRHELRWAVFGFGILLALLLGLVHLLAAGPARSEPPPRPALFSGVP